LKVFISWSGAVSQQVAEALDEWLPNVIQAVEPWVSTNDIQAGTRWGADIARQLEESRFGIICLTPDNLAAPWILFEAGALSKAVAGTFVCPYLFHVEPSDLTGPLTQFQATRADREGAWQLVKTVNSILGEGALSAASLDRCFDKWWPDLENQLNRIELTREGATLAHGNIRLL